MFSVINTGTRFNKFEKGLFTIFITLYLTTNLNWPDWLYFYRFFCFEYFDSSDR